MLSSGHPLAIGLPRVVSSAVLVAGLLFGQPSHAASSPDTAGKVNRLMDASGMSHSVRQVLPGLVSSFDDPNQKVPLDMRKALREAAEQAFRPGLMIERIRARFGTALTARQLDDALAWLDSPLGRRITALENAAADPAAGPRMEAYAREIEKRPPAKSRSDLIGELNLATGAGDFNAVIVEAAILASALGLNAAQPVQQQQPPDVIRQRVNSSVPGLRKMTEKLVTLEMLYAYQSLSDQELRSYLKFVKSPSGAAYSKAAVAGFTDAMMEANGRFMQALPKAVAKHKGASST